MADAPTGKVTFVGAGPGAADLLTFRAARAIAEADVVIWAASLVQAEVLVHAREDAEILDSATMSLEDVVAVYERARSEGLKVARIHSGDPALWGGTQEQLDRCEEIGLATEIVPGVSVIQTPGHTWGTMSLRVDLPNEGTKIFTSDAVYMEESYGPPAIGAAIVWSSLDWLESVEKLRRIEQETGAEMIFGHDEAQRQNFKMGPDEYYS